MRLYRALLRLYPRSFRAEYGEQILDDLATRRAAAGFVGRVGLAAETIADTVIAAGRLHTDLLAQDIRYTFRTLRRAPGFAATAILLTAVGTGATTAALAVADHVLLRPLPYRAPDRLVNVWQEDTTVGGHNVLSPANYLDLIASTTAFEKVAAYTPRSANLVGEGAPVRLEGHLATGDLFDVLGRSAAIGRTFTAADAEDSAPDVVVLSYGAWQTYFAGDPATLGRDISLNGIRHTVIGVMPRDFMFPDRRTEFWAPLSLSPAALGPGYDDRTNTFLWTVARLADDVTLVQADAQLDRTAADLARLYPDENESLGILIVGLRGTLTRASRTMVAAVAGAALCLLLIAVTNLAGLILSRGLSRQREMAVRAAIGAGRERLIRQMLTESALIALAGGALGAVLAWAGAPLLARLVPTSLPIAETPAIDWRFAALAAAAALVTALACGVLPARRAAAGASPSALRESSRTGSSRRTERLRGALVVAQVTISVALLVGVGLLAQALWRVQARDPGFDPQGVLTLRTSLPWPKYGPTAPRVAFYDRVLDDIRALPGVDAAGFITGLPMEVGGLIWETTPEGGAAVGPRQLMVGLRFVTPGYFDAMRIPIRDGRDFAAGDTFDAPFVAIVSQSYADRHWPGQSAIGRRVNIAFFDRLIVGVAGDVRVRGLERESEPQLYLPAPQVPDFGLMASPPKDLVIRASVPPLSLLPAVRGIVARADPEQPIANVALLQDVIDGQLAPRSTQLAVLGAFAAFAAGLAAIGLYGMLAFAVGERMREIGLRMALGATPRMIVGDVLARGLRLAAGGIVVGAALAWIAGRWMESILAGVSPHDVRVFVTAIGFTALLALAGTLLPALRASRVSPLDATRM